MLEVLYTRDNRIKKWLVWGGVLLVLAGFIPFVLLGEGSVVTVHDQLDGELMAYLLHAKYLGTGIRFYPEWMGGVDATALTPPALLPVLLYRVFKPFTAFILNQLVVALTAFAGMYFFLEKLIGGESRWEQLTAFLVALMFSYLPFYSVYGLCVAGIPMLACAVRMLAERKNIGTGLLLTAYYGLMSSFVLIGYAVTGLLWVYALVLLWKDISDKKSLRDGHLPVYAAVLGLTLYYIGTNLELVLQVFGKGETQVSHKTELVLSGLDFREAFLDMFVNGSGHAASLHRWMIIPVLLVLLVFIKKRSREYRLLLGFFGAALLIALFYAFLHCPSVVDVRNNIGGAAVFFQIDRVYWFYPFLWYTMPALCVKIIYDNTVISGGQGRRTAGLAISLLLLALCGGNVLWQSDFKKNVRQLAGPETSNSVTWEKYFSPVLFESVRSYIGRDQTQYRVGCIGLHPAAAAYNGFYTVDGYSNNYPLSYKHAFRKVIEKELDKDSALKTYFDDWGNRCYLFSSELGMNYYVDKTRSSPVRGLELDTQRLGELGCEYLFSAVEIENAQDMGLRLESVFGWDEGDYNIYLYAVG